MTKQETHKSIYAALAAAQAEMGKALKDATNPHFKSKYADLSNVMDACMPALNKHGICVVQPVVETEIGRCVKTVLIFEDGERLECSVPLILGKQDMQGLGSAITYARRYGLMSMAGIAPDDDDGNAAAATGPANSARAGLNDAWRDGVLDSLPEGATQRETAEAFAEAICKEFAGKGERALDNAWERFKGYVAKFKAEHPDLEEKVQDAFLTRQNEIFDEKNAIAGDHPGLAAE